MARISETILQGKATRLRRVYEFIPLRSDARNGSNLSDRAYERISQHFTFIPYLLKINQKSVREENN